MSVDLTDDEIDAICEGLKQSAAMVRYLRGLGLTVRQKPNGRPLVNRGHYDAMMSGRPKPEEAGASGGIKWRVPA